MMMIEIRKAIQYDIDTLIRCDQIAKIDAFRVELIKDWVMANECYVAMLSNQITGYAVLNTRFFHQANIEMLYVHPDFRKQGVGKALLNDLMSHTGTEKLWVTTNLSNHPMQRLLAQEGFKPSGYIDNLDEDDPELVFVKFP